MDKIFRTKELARQMFAAEEYAQRVTYIFKGLAKARTQITCGCDDLLCVEGMQLSAVIIS
jgi:hypothetical protein